MVSKTGPVVEPLPAEVVKFAEQHGLAGFVDKALQAASEAFRDGEAIAARLSRDPEFGYPYVEVHVTLNPAEEPETEAEKYSRCVVKWAHFIPPEVGGKIHLSTSWAS